MTTNGKAWIQMGVGAALLLLGGIGTYSANLPQMDRAIAPESVLLVFCGPAFLTVGILLIWRATTNRLASFRRASCSRVALSLGIVLIVVGLLPLAYMVLWQAVGLRPWEGAGMLLVISCILMVFPGLACAAIAAVFLYRDKARAESGKD